MKRLTTKLQGGTDMFGAPTVTSYDLDLQTAQGRIKARCVLGRLEDILYDEDDTEIITLNRLRELVQADKEGRCYIKHNAAFAVGDTVRITDALDHSCIGKVGTVVSVSNYTNWPVSYRLDIGGGDWLQGMLAREDAEAALKGANLASATPMNP